MLKPKYQFAVAAVAYHKDEQISSDGIRVNSASQWRVLIHIRHVATHLYLCPSQQSHAALYA